MTSNLPVGYDFAVEISYPIGEGISSGLLNCVAQVGRGVVLINKYLHNSYQNEWYFIKSTGNYENLIILKQITSK